jgi:hypothetical protein
MEGLQQHESVAPFWTMEQFRKYHRIIILLVYEDMGMLDHVALK